MLARTPRWTFDQAGFDAEVEKIKAEQRSRRQLAFDRAAWWERTMQSLEDYDDSLGDRPANRR
jgi:hypothetical protein